MRVARALAVGWLAFGVPACSLLVSTSDLAGAPVDENQRPDADGAALAEAANDAPVVTEAASDAAADGGPCSPSDIRCDEFERAEPRGPWAEALVDDGGGLAIVTAPTGRALQTTVTAGTAAARAELFEQTSRTVTGVITVRSRLRIATPSGAGGAHVNAIAIHEGNANRDLIVFFYAQASGVRLASLRCAPTCSYEQTPVIDAISYDAWHDVEYRVDLAAVPTAHAVTVDGTVVSLNSQLQSAGFTTGTLAFSAGIHYVDDTHGSFRVAVDDYRIDAP